MSKEDLENDNENINEQENVEENDIVNNEQDYKSNERNEQENYKDKYLRLLAEFDNYQKFKDKEHETVKCALSKDIILEIIPVLEDLEKAKQSENEADGENNKINNKGIEIIYNKLKHILKSKGLRKMHIEKGDTFDHNLHEAVTYIESDLEDGKIVEVIQNGYLLDNMIIKHPKVVVSKGNECNDDKECKNKECNYEKCNDKINNEKEKIKVNENNENEEVD